MKSRLINSAAEKTYVVVFDEGDEPVLGLLQFAGQERLGASRFTSIGGFSEVTIGYFDLEKRDYIPIRLHERVEGSTKVSHACVSARACIRRTRIFFSRLRVLAMS